MKLRTMLLGAALLGLGLGTVTSCTGPSDTGTSQSAQFVLPDLYGKTLKQAKLAVGAGVLFDTYEVATTELVEGRILGYVAKRPGDSVTKGSRVTLKIAKRSTSSRTMADDSLIDYVTDLYTITGYHGVNAGLCQMHGQGGTDLGIPVELPDGKMMFLYGDTFSNDNGGMSAGWKSNFMAISSDGVYWDDLIFDDIVHNDNSEAIIPFAEGNHQGGNADDRNVEVTKIPTGAITLGEDVYIFYMSIRYWGVGGSWLVNFNQCIKADDSTYKSWTPVTSLKWGEEEFYYGGQIYPFLDPKDEERVYFTSIPGGRNDGAVMFRVKKTDFENRSEYEYLVGANQWVKGDGGMALLNAAPYYVLSPGVAEPCIMYSSYLNKYLFSTLKGSSIIIATSDNVAGPYNKNYQVATQTTHPGLYGGFIHPKLSDCDGQRLFLQLSRWTPIYNTSMLEVVFK